MKQERHGIEWLVDIYLHDDGVHAIVTVKMESLNVDAPKWTPQTAQIAAIMFLSSLGDYTIQERTQMDKGN